MSNDTPKFTPGPWHVDAIAPGLIGTADKSVCTCLRDWNIGEEERAANAALMAKAPAFYADEKDKIVHLKTLKAQVLSLKEKVPMPLCTPDFIARYIDEIIEDTEKLLAGARGEVAR